MKNSMKIAFASGAAVLAGMAGNAQAQDLNGFYAGISMNKAVGGDLQWTYYSDGGGDVGGAAMGVFLGYNFALQNGWVAGAELAFSESYDIDSYSGVQIEDVMDLKARLGKTFGKTYAYGILGYSSADVSWASAPDFMQADGSGVSYGLGIETSFDNNGFIGGEILRRNIDAKNDADPYNAYKVDDLTTISIRAGFRF
ncbi:porin family protein [Sedimentimonas flavescens]|uniref:Porin family protein n=1 Tax=Sedimentimonas flavescens TaxID=2851012 RepID=A0ABT3A0F2_9RHOB|nr:porin family protein [Sedimentimonas flavescens]MCV2879403.1 porin family protein [Sedimentimonas flavescens]